MINQKNKILTINRLDYNFDSDYNRCGCANCECPDILASDMKISLLKGEVLLKSIDVKDLNSDSKYLADVIKNVTIDLNDLEEDLIDDWNSNDYRIIIEYNNYNEQDNKKNDVNLDIKLDLHEIYANNKLFY